MDSSFEKNFIEKWCENSLEGSFYHKIKSIVFENFANNFFKTCQKMFETSLAIKPNKFENKFYKHMRVLGH